MDRVALLALLASMDEWLGNDKMLTNEDIIDWRDMLAKGLGEPSMEENYKARSEAIPVTPAVEGETT